MYVRQGVSTHFEMKEVETDSEETRYNGIWLIRCVESAVHKSSWR